ncbi:MAG: B12-binding domain-containing radical SAM protein [Sandaracinaceae bacterium]|nr:B12-binding domain-containing radical SAM protein [Sandaracinaceae bacterium]
MPLRVALVNPIMSRDAEMPLGLLYVAEAAERAGHEVRVLDTGFTSSPAHLWPALERFAPDVVGFTVMSVTYPQALRMAREAKQRTGAKVVMGGPHATLYPVDVAGDEAVDAAVCGDGDLSFPMLLEAIEGRRTGAVPGVAHTLGADLALDPNIPRVADLDTLPFPERARYEALDAYIAAMGHSYLFGGRALTMITSRGCPWSCSYCQPVLDHIHGKKVRIRSTDNVVAELEHLKARHGIDSIWFCDDTFTFDARWVTDLCRKMIDRRLALRWSCNSRVDTVSPELLAIMAEAGCIQLRFGMESGSQILLDRTMNKGTTVSECERAFRWADEAGIRTWAYTMVGGLDETRETVGETRRMLEKLAPAHVQITMLAPLPKTYFAERISEHESLRVLPHGLGGSAPLRRVRGGHGAPDAPGGEDPPTRALCRPSGLRSGAHHASRAAALGRAPLRSRGRALSPQEEEPRHADPAALAPRSRGRARGARCRARPRSAADPRAPRPRPRAREGSLRSGRTPRLSFERSGPAPMAPPTRPAPGPSSSCGAS